MEDIIKWLPESPRKIQSLNWLLLVSLIILEYFLFRTYLLREVVPFYPKAFDQTGYLSESYKLYEEFISNGLITSLHHLNLLPQTFLFHVQAALFFIFFGASRLSALSINFIYFAVLQLLSFSYIKQLTHRYLFSFLFIGILLSTETFRWANDFRIDFIACCLYGLFCCSVLRSNIFLNKQWVFISLLISVLLINMRFITSCYIFGTTGLLFCYYLLAWIIKRKKQCDLSLICIRVKNLFIFNAGAAAIFAPILWLNRHLLYNYYFVGHVTGDERLMRLKAALSDFGMSSPLLFYPKAFLIHFPYQLLLKVAIVLLVYLFFYLIGKLLYANSSRGILKNKTYDYFNSVLFLVIAILVPFTILTMDTSKSSLVIGIILVPFIYLIVFFLYGFYQNIFSFSEKTAHYLLVGSAVSFLFIGAHIFVGHMLVREGAHLNRDDTVARVSKLVEDVGDYANFLHWRSINASSDKIADYINAPITPFYYEKRGVLIDVSPSKLGVTEIISVTKQEAVNALKKSDIYTSDLTNYIPDKIFPFENSIKNYRFSLREMADKNMIRLGDYYIDHSMFRVYARPDVRLHGLVNGWVTQDGTWLEVPSIVAKQIRTITLEGKSHFGWLAGHPLSVRGTADIAGNSVPVDVHLTISDGHYQLRCQLPAWHSDKPLFIHLVFSQYFSKTDETDAIKQVMLAPQRKIFIKDNAEAIRT